MKSLQIINVDKLKIPFHRSHKFWPYITILCLIVLMCSSCDKYKCTERIEGIFYPNGTVQLWCFVDETIKARYVTFNQPTRVTEIGIKTLGWGWGPSTGKKVEVAKLELSNKTVYTHLEFLNNYGRFEYQERSETLKEWIGEHPILTVLLAILALTLAVYSISRKPSIKTLGKYSSGSYSSNDSYSPNSYSDEKVDFSDEKEDVRHSNTKIPISQKGYTKNKQNWLGEEYTQHYSEDNDKTGYSKDKENWLGEEYTQHYSEDNDKTGYSKDKENWLGEEYTQHYDEDNDKTGYSKKKENWLGEEYIQHYDEEGNKTGYSKWKENWFGEKYIQHYDEDGNPID